MLDCLGDPSIWLVRVQVLHSCHCAPYRICQDSALPILIELSALPVRQYEFDNARHIVSAYE